jgi:hypothetical protein
MAPLNKTLKQLNSDFAKTIGTRGAQKVAKKNQKDNSKPAISPTIVGLLIFIICGSAVIGLLQTLLNSYLTPEPNYQITPEMMQQYQEQQAMAQGFGNLSDYPLSEVYNADDSAPVDVDVAQHDTLNLDEVIENE